MANLEKVLIIQLPADDFLFWDAVGRLADAFAKLALEDPYAECLQKMWTFDPFEGILCSGEKQWDFRDWRFTSICPRRTARTVVCRPVWRLP